MPRRFLSRVKRCVKKFMPGLRKQGTSRDALSDFELKVSKRLWRQSATRLGIDLVEKGDLMIMGHDTFRVYRYAISSESNAAAKICVDKVATNSLLKQGGVIVPEGREFGAHLESEAIDCALLLARPVVLKPARGSGFGSGVSVCPTGRAAISEAFHLAARHTGEVLVEEFIAGENYRVLVHRGRCLSNLARQLAAVVGDGSSTVRELAERENEGRVQNWEWKQGLTLPIPIAAATTAILKRSGLTWDSVPSQGRKVVLADVCNYQHGTTYREMMAETHPSTIRAAEKACEILGVTLGGVDVISPDVRSNQYCINEVNTGPLLLIHYAPEFHHDVVTDILRTEIPVNP